jgi:hypothetical protein
MPFGIAPNDGYLLRALNEDYSIRSTNLPDGQITKFLSSPLRKNILFGA